MTVVISFALTQDSFSVQTLFPLRRFSQYTLDPFSTVQFMMSCFSSSIRNGVKSKTNAGKTILI